jgi:hypothetical protein
MLFLFIEVKMKKNILMFGGGAWGCGCGATFLNATRTKHIFQMLDPMPF